MAGPCAEIAVLVLHLLEFSFVILFLTVLVTQVFIPACKVLSMKSEWLIASGVLEELHAPVADLRSQGPRGIRGISADA